MPIDNPNTKSTSTFVNTLSYSYVDNSPSTVFRNIRGFLSI